MSKITVDETWILNQLAGIRSLEREVSRSLSGRKAQARAGNTQVARQMAQLNAWVNLVDYALTVRAQRTLAGI